MLFVPPWYFVLFLGISNSLRLSHLECLDAFDTFLRIAALEIWAIKHTVRGKSLNHQLPPTNG
eukprot:m.251307 g.251307  ORF g.251307 m.251307 type:complete len:63 (-) comp33893_c2_seq7:210-398(-)